MAVIDKERLKEVETRGLESGVSREEMAKQAARAAYNDLYGKGAAEHGEKFQSTDWLRFQRAVVNALAASQAPETIERLREARMSQAIRDVQAERERQISAEGWTPEHDDEHKGKEMAYAAACYAVGDHRIVGMDANDRPIAEASVWPWHRDWWKPADHRRNCVKAAALLVAEIERLDRAALSSQENKDDR